MSQKQSVLPEENVRLTRKNRNYMDFIFIIFKMESNEIRTNNFRINANFNGDFCDFIFLLLIFRMSIHIHTHIRKISNSREEISFIFQEMNYLSFINGIQIICFEVVNNFLFFIRSVWFFVLCFNTSTALRFTNNETKYYLE